MSDQGQPNMQNEAAAALSGRPPQQMQSQGAPQPGGSPQASLGAVAQAFARCEQTKQCTPQDRQILEAGLPQLIQMAKMIQQILQASAAQPQQGGAPAPQPAPGPQQ